MPEILLIIVKAVVLIGIVALVIWVLHPWKDL